MCTMAIISTSYEDQNRKLNEFLILLEEKGKNGDENLKIFASQIRPLNINIYKRISLDILVQNCTNFMF
jgi:hypothetical protein